MKYLLLGLYLTTCTLFAKIGLINKSEVQNKSVFWQNHLKKINEVNNSYEEKLVEFENKINALMQELSTAKYKNHEANLEEKENEMRALQEEASTKASEAQKKLNTIYVANKKKFSNAYKKALQEIARKNKIDVVLNEEIVEYNATSVVNLTPDVIEKTNAVLSDDKVEKPSRKVKENEAR